MSLCLRLLSFSKFLYLGPKTPKLSFNCFEYFKNFKIISSFIFDKSGFKTKKYLAHDAENTIAIGENVKIQETKPLSKNKSWEVIK